MFFFLRPKICNRYAIESLDKISIFDSRFDIRLFYWSSVRWLKTSCFIHGSLDICIEDLFSFFWAIIFGIRIFRHRFLRNSNIQCWAFLAQCRAKVLIWNQNMVLNSLSQRENQILFFHFFKTKAIAQMKGEDDLTPYMTKCSSGTHFVFFKFDCNFKIYVKMMKI